MKNIDLNLKGVKVITKSKAKKNIFCLNKLIFPKVEHSLPILNFEYNQGTLTEGEGSVPFTSLLRKLVL